MHLFSRRGTSRSFPDGFKRRFLGEPLTSEQLESERLSNPVALGALSPDAISSTAYGPEQIMVELLPRAGMAAFALLLPIIGVILVILLLVTLSYRGVVTAYTRAGGSYMVARENFGPRVAQVAAAALLIDYVVTAAVQPAAGTTAVVSAIPVLRPYHLEITIGVLLLICFANLRGLRQSGRAFAITTYSFVVMITLSAHASAQRGIADVAAHGGIALAVAVLSAIVYACYGFAPAIAGRIKPQTAHGVQRVIAFLLLSIGVQITWNGVAALLGTLPRH